MTEQERKQRIEEFGYPPHVPCGECTLYQNYNEISRMMDAQILQYCRTQCEYYKEITMSKNSNI